MVEEMERYGEDEDRVALLWENESGDKRVVTYSQLVARSNQLANALSKQGIKKGDKLVVLMPKVPETYMIYMAALKMGVILMPGSELLTSKDILYRINHAEAEGILVYHSLADRVDEIRNEALSLKYFITVGGRREGFLSYEELIDGESEEFERVNTKSDDIAFISYTSGTTGNPKGVIHHHSWGYAHQRVAAKAWMDIKEGDVVWATAGPGWAKWVWSPFVSTLSSGAIGFHYFGRFNPEKYLQLIDQYKVNVLCCTPTEYRLMAKVDHLDRFSLSSLHSAVSAGEPLNREVIETFKKYFGVEVRDGYGQTENSLLIGNLKGAKIKPGSMGKPSPGNWIGIIDEEGNLVPRGVVGDIALHRSAPTLFKGYYRDPERTKMAFRGDWYVTGDQAMEDEEGYYWFEGRADDIIISAGYTIGPFEVEDALVKHEAVKECAVVASPDEIRGSIVKAFVVLKDPTSIQGEGRAETLIKELQEHVKKITAPYKYPREIEFVEDLPKTTSGKIRRVELRKMEREKKLKGENEIR
nr:acyl--CoA ligase [Thermicanus aegyptius]